MEAGGIEPPSRDNPNGGLYMLRRLFDLERTGGNRHSPSRSSRLFLILASTAEREDQPTDFGLKRRGHSPQTEVALIRRPCDTDKSCCQQLSFARMFKEANQASSACHHHRSHPVETDRPR